MHKIHPEKSHKISIENFSQSGNCLAALCCMMVSRVKREDSRKGVSVWGQPSGVKKF